MYRIVCLIIGAVILALTFTNVMHHLLVVPVDDATPWVLAIVTGLFLIGVAIMPEKRP